MKNVIHPEAGLHPRSQLESPVRIDRFAKVQRRSRVGRFSYLSEGAFLGEDSTLGRFCSVAKNVEIGAIGHPTDWLSTHPFQYSTHHFRKEAAYRGLSRQEHDRKGGVNVGHDVWIGTNAVILRGVSIGHGAVIGAGAFVNTDVGPYQIVVGLPAKPLRRRFDETTVERLLAVCWWDMDLSQLDGVPFNDINAALDLLEARRAACPVQDAPE